MGCPLFLRVVHESVEGGLLHIGYRRHRRRRDSSRSIDALLIERAPGVPLAAHQAGGALQDAGIDIDGTRGSAELGLHSAGRSPSRVTDSRADRRRKQRRAEQGPLPAAPKRSRQRRVGAACGLS